MNYIVVNSVCCCLSVCCKQVWQSLYRIIGKAAFVKFAYILVYFGAVAGSIGFISLMNSSWSWFMQTLAPGIDCKYGFGTEYMNCLSSSVVYRISLCLLLFSIIMLLILQLCSARVALIINQGLFFSKFVTIVIVFFITLRMDNQVFMAYGQFCKVISYVFVACQSMILIDLAYLWGIRWAKRYSDGSQLYAILLIGLSVIFFGGCLAFLITSFKAHNQTLLWADIICSVQLALVIGVQLLNFNKQNSLLTTTALCLLICYCTWSAGYSHPISTQTGIPNETILYINMGVLFILLMISTAGSIYGSSNKQEEENRFVDLDNISAAPQQVQMHIEQKNKWVQWMLYLTGMSAYIAMVVTDWGSADVVRKQFNLTTGAWASKLLMGNIIFVMYTWSLLAPRLCPHRNFYFQ